MKLMTGPRRSSSFLFAGIVIAYLVMLPLLLPDEHKAYDIERISQSGIMLVAAMSVRPFSWPGAMRRAIWLLMIVLVLVSTLASSMPWIAAREVLMYAGLFLIALACAQMDSDARTWVLDGLVVGWLVYGLLVLLTASVALVRAESIYPWSFLKGFANPRHLNHAQIVVVHLLLLRALQAGASTLLRRCAWLALVLQGFLVGVSQGRAILVAMLGAMVVMAILGRKQGRRMAVLLLSSQLLGLALYVLIFHGLADALGQVVHGYRLTADQLVNDHSRGRLLGIAWGHAMAHPWLGIGPMHFAHQPNGAGAHPHNIFLQWAAELGLPAALLAMGLLVDTMLNKWRQVRHAEEPDGVMLYAGMTAVLIDACFSGNLVMPLSQTYIALLYGWGLRHDTKSAGTETAAGRVSHVRVIHVLGVLLLLYAIQAWQEFVMQEPAISGGQYTEALTGRRNPRFWQQGWF